MRTMSVSKGKSCKKTAAIVSVAAAFTVFSAGVQASGGGIYNQGELTITGTTLGNDIDVSYTRAGVHVRVDRQEELFREPVHTIAIDAGEGDNTVQYRQLVTSDISLRIVAGAGEDDIDIEFDLNDRSDSRIPTFGIEVDAGGGADRVKVKFPWLSEDDPQFDFMAEIRPGGGEHFTPEIGDEVVVAIEYGHPDRPVIIGAVYNSGGAAGTETPRLGLRNLARTLSATTEVQFTGGNGNDKLDLSVDYSGVRLQQGAVVLEADFNEGDNRFDGRYIASSAGHMHVSSAIVAGDGDNEISLMGHKSTHAGQQLGGIIDGTSKTIMLSEINLGHGNNTVHLNTSDYGFVHHHLELGNGDNATEIRFGDGEHGRRLPTGERTVSATYRSGAGSDTILIDGEVNLPTDATFILEPGGENNQLQGKYIFGDWSTGALPQRGRPVLSQAKVVLLAPFDELDFTIEERPPAGARGRPAEFVVIVVGQQAQGTLNYAKTVVPASPVGSVSEFKYIPVRRTFTLHEMTADELSVAIIDDESRISLDLADASLRRGILESDHIELYPVIWGAQVGTERKSRRAELEGLDVFGSAAVGVHISGAGTSRTIFRDVRVNESATLSYGGIHLWDITDPANPSASEKKDGAILIQGKDITIKALELHDLQIEGVFTADLRSGGSSASFNAEDVEIERGTIHSSSVAVEELKIVNEGFEMNFEGLEVLGAFAMEMRGALLSYIQDHVVIGPGADMAVALNGGDGKDKMLALLRDIAITGDGRYSFTAYGGAGDDFGAVLARDLDLGAEGSMSIEVLGGDDNDALALAVLAEPLRTGRMFARIDGGEGFNSCFATSNVLVENCDHKHDLKDILLLLRRHLAGADMVNSREYTDEWSRALYDLEGDEARLFLNAVPYMAGLEDPTLPSAALTASVSRAGDLVISWPEANSEGYVLQATPTLAPANWQPLETAPVVIDGQRKVSLRTTNSTRFFRLRKP
jgi:hypothetical protein